MDAVTRKPRGRRKGRPTIRGSVGKEALIAAAREALKRKPPGEITLFEISQIAGVDPSLIRYYFGQLQDLFAEAAADITRDMRSRLAVLIAEKGSARDKLERRIRVYLEVFRANPHYHRLVIEAVHLSDNPIGKTVLRLLQQSLEELGDIVREGVEQGELKQLDPRLLQLTIAAMCEFFYSAHPIFGAIFGSQAKDPKFVDKYAKFIIAFITETEGVKRGAPRRGASLKSSRRSTPRSAQS